MNAAGSMNGSGRRVVIAGASGFIGRALDARYRAAGDEVITVGRGAGSSIAWSDQEALARAVDGSALVVNLAGRSINTRFTPRHRAEILDSRLQTTRAIGEAIARAAAPPPLWLNASTTDIYRHEVYVPQTEQAGVEAEGFVADVARRWEQELFAPPLPATRRAALRTSIVLGPGGALRPLAALTRLGLGGAQWDGRWPRSARRATAGIDHHYGTRRGLQKVSWIQLDDVVGVIRFLEHHPELDGPVNTTAPLAVDSRQFMAALRSALGVPLGLPLHRWMLELGAWAIRVESELLLKSRWVRPEKLIEAGYTWRHPYLEDALRASLSRSRPETMKA